MSLLGYSNALFIESLYLMIAWPPFFIMSSPKRQEEENFALAAWLRQKQQSVLLLLLRVHVAFTSKLYIYPPTNQPISVVGKKRTPSENLLSFAQLTYLCVCRRIKKKGARYTSCWVPRVHILQNKSISRPKARGTTFSKKRYH